MNPIYLLGDHHGDYKGVLTELHEKGIRNATLIHVGDGEEGYPHWDATLVGHLNGYFASMDIEYLSIRGNHSNPHVFDGSVNLSHFKLLPDYTRLELNEQSWLFVGGAHSIDRIDRERGKTWWPEEAMVLRPELAGQADVLVTHSGPDWIGPVTNDPFVEMCCRFEEVEGIDTLRKELPAERERHNVLFEIVKPKTWYFGHFHRSEETTHQGCLTRILDVSELFQHPSLRLPQSSERMTLCKPVMKHTFLRRFGVLLIAALSHSAAPAAEFPVERILTDTTGRKLEVIVLDKDEAKIKVPRKSDGKEFSLDLATVSQEDQTFLKDYSIKKKEAFTLCEVVLPQTEPKMRNWVLKSGQTVFGRASSVNDDQEAVFIERQDGVTQIVLMTELSEEDVDQAYLQDAGATFKPSTIHKFTLKGKPLNARLIHIDIIGIILAPSKGRILRDIQLEDLSKDDVEFVQAWYENVKKE